MKNIVEHYDRVHLYVTHPVCKAEIVALDPLIEYPIMAQHEKYTAHSVDENEMEAGPSVVGSTCGKEKESEGTFVGSTEGKEKDHGPSVVGHTEVENGCENIPNYVGTTCEKRSETGPTLVGEIHDGADINEEGCVDLNGVGGADINEEACVDLNDAGFVDLNDAGGPSVDAEPTGVEETGSGGVEAKGEPTVVEETGAGGVEVGAKPTVVEETSAGGVEVGAEHTGVKKTSVEETGVEGNLDEGGEIDDSALDIRFPGEEDDDCWLAGNFDNEIGGLDDEELRGDAFNDDPVRENFEGVDGEENVTVGDGNAGVNGDDGGVTSVNAQPTTGAGVDSGKYIF